MSRKMIDYKVEDGKITSIDGYEVGGGGGYKIKKLTITENGLYDSEFEAYKPVYVNVPQVAQGGSLKALLDGTKSTQNLFYYYEGTNVDGLISYSDTANVKSMNSMFFQCYNLTSVPQLDTSNTTKMEYMFKQCEKLTTIPKLDTSNVISMSGMFSYCTKLTTVPELDVSKATSFTSMFQNCTSLTSIGIYGFRYSIDITDTALEHDAIVALLNQAGIPVNSYGNQTIKMGTTKLELLSDEEKAIATNKGWRLA